VEPATPYQPDSNLRSPQTYDRVSARRSTGSGAITVEGTEHGDISACFASTRRRRRPPHTRQLGWVVQDLRPAQSQLHLPRAPQRRQREQLLPPREPKPRRRL